ncbi:MAG: hypothetical protein K5694_03320, partial [Bacilli bacterium]|nr:hypothetical protein [Bacilli bacterium]
HETGHMMGLDDYYSYDYDGQMPAGGVDMMDLNIGDHCAYSKILFDWVDPYVAKGDIKEFDITLRPFESSGDCLMLIDPSAWNGTPYDEYLTLEYYTPTGLNELDSHGYQDWYGLGTGGTYTERGLKMFHVDSRLRVNRRTTTYASDYQDNYYLANSNTPSQSVKSTNLLMEAIPASGENLFKCAEAEANLGNNDVLFSTADYEGGSSSFAPSSYTTIFSNGDKFNNGDTIPWSFSITSQSDTEITLHITCA